MNQHAFDNDIAVSAADFAREIGRDPALISRWKKADRLVLDADGSIFVEASKHKLSKLLNPIRGGRRGGEATSTPDEPQPTGKDSDNDIDDARALTFGLGWAAAMNTVEGGDGRDVDPADVEAGAKFYVGMGAR